MSNGKRYKIKLVKITSKTPSESIIKDIDDHIEVEISFDHPKLLLYQLFRRCHDFITAETDKNLASLGSSQAQYQVLRILIDLGSVSMSKISKLLFRGKSNSTTLIDRMERAGLVERINLKEDRRVNNIAITQKGRRLHDKIAKHHRAFILEIFNDLSDQEVEVLFKLLEKTVLNLNPDGIVFNGDVLG